MVLDQEGAGVVGDAVRVGSFPRRLRSSPFQFRLHRGPVAINVDGLITAIAESAHGLPSCIGVLDLGGGRMGGRALTLLAASGRGGSRGKLPHLESLCLRRCEMNDGMLRWWGEVFLAHVCPKLKSLDLRENRIRREGVSAFLHPLAPQTLPQLRWLRFEGQEGLEGEEQRRDFASSVTALRGAAHQEGKLLKWTGEVEENSESGGSGQQGPGQQGGEEESDDSSEESESEGEDSSSEGGSSDDSEKAGDALA
eukprot:Cvel_28126.t1-p1 / transcript=Cvel_28126.t1 / gene=Cvel_28126 / organism=Chromera_velia_CCMP2878 / gene_product=hypothetical protein / transcript_product=hypothetical protein / location=Cvel_scaffold3627:4822-5577(-) / protein_length=252 / sequence_SO=supercontig / SO=protein_coding / is_pseudo=false